MSCCSAPRRGPVRTRGLHGLTWDDVLAEAAGVVRSTLYENFGTTEGLLSALVEWVLEELADDLGGIALGAGDHRHGTPLAAEAVLDRFLALLVADRDRARVLAYLCLDRPASWERVRTVMSRALHAAMSPDDVLERHRNRASRDAAVELLVAVLPGIAFSVATGRDDDARTQVTAVLALGTPD